MRTSKISRIERALASDIRAIWKQAAELYWSHDKILEAREKRIYGHPEWSKLPRYSQAYLSGVWDTMFALHWDKLEFAYTVHNVIYLVDSPQWKALQPFDSMSKWDMTGRHVYRDNIHANFNEKTTVVAA